MQMVFYVYKYRELRETRNGIRSNPLDGPNNGVLPSNNHEDISSP